MVKFSGLFAYVASLALANGSILACKALHKALLRNCLRSPMSFFDTTPLGRIINRFSRDMDVIDVQMALNVESTLKCVMHVIATIFVISYSTPLFTAVVIPLGIFYFLVQVTICFVFYFVENENVSVMFGGKSTGARIPFSTGS